jgi:hypothetical protein
MNKDTQININSTSPKNYSIRSHISNILKYIYSGNIDKKIPVNRIIFNNHEYLAPQKYKEIKVSHKGLPIW